MFKVYKRPAICITGTFCIVCYFYIGIQSFYLSGISKIIILLIEQEITKCSKGILGYPLLGRVRLDNLLKL